MMARAARLELPSFWSQRLTPKHFFWAILAALPIVWMMSNTPASWWVQSGFESYPGTFVHLATDQYPLCRPWRDAVPGTHREKGSHVAFRAGTLNGGAAGNFALLLPKSAQVTAIYCGSALGSAALAECSVLHCPVPAHAMIDDSVYTLGRGITFNMRNRDGKPGETTKVGFWVIWR